MQRRPILGMALYSHNQRRIVSRFCDLVGMVEPPAINSLVGVDASISKERPVSACRRDLRKIAFGDEFTFVGVTGFAEHVAVGIGQEGPAPEFNLAFSSDSIRRSDKQSVGDRMAAHH